MSRARDLADYVSTGVTSTELDKLDGLTATTDELNLVDGSVTGPLSHRNMVINGAMQVAQRGTGFSNVHDAQYAADRFRFSCANEDQLQLSITRENSGPTGFSNSIRLNVTTAESAIDSNEYARITTAIEGQDLQHLDYGASGAKTTTISFWVKSALTGTYAIILYQVDGTKIIGTTYTINIADTWEKKTITFVGNTAQAITNDNTLGIQIEWMLLAGSLYTSTDNSSWDTFSNGRFAYGHTAAWGTNTSHDFWLSGVQWEVGTVATPFEHRSYADALRRCKRYFQELFGRGHYVEAYTVWFLTATNWSVSLHYPEEMRAVPSAVFIEGTPVDSSGGTVGVNNWSVYLAGNWKGISTMSTSVLSPVAMRLNGSTNDSVTAGQSGGLYAGSNCYIQLTAEIFS